MMNKVFSLHLDYNMLRNIVLVLSVLFFYSKPAWSLGNCSGTYTADETGERHNCQTDDTLTVGSVDDSDVEIRNAGEDITVILNDDDDVTIENYGTINGKNYTIKVMNSEGAVINNYSTGDIKANKSSAIYLKDTDGIRINNYGTIQADTYGAIFNDVASEGDIYIHNEGTIKTNTEALGACGAANLCRSAIGIVGGGGQRQ